MNELNCVSVNGASLHDPSVECGPVQHWYKPQICVYRTASGEKRIRKSYPISQGPIAPYFRLLASHEFRMLERVQGLPFTPNQVEKGVAHEMAISYDYVDGQSINVRFKNGNVPERFFARLYRAVNELHEKGVAHLDVGNSGNILVSPDGNPILIDFGSAMPLKLVPLITRSWARKKDLVGVLKLWHRYDNNTMPEILEDYFNRHYRKNIYTPKRFVRAFRRFWSSDGSEMSEIGAITGLFFGLLFLVTIF